MRFPQWRRGLSPKITENTLASWPIVGFGTANKEADLARYGGTARNLIVSSSAATFPSGRTNHAPVDNAYIRNSANQYFYHNGVGGQDSVSLQGSWTISFWAKRTGIGGGTRNSILSYGGTTTSETQANNFQVICGVLSASGMMECFWEYTDPGPPVLGGRNVQIESGVVMPLDEWHHYTYRKNGTTDFKFYIDGKLVSTQTVCIKDGVAGQPIVNCDGGTGGSVWWRFGATQNTQNNFYGHVGALHVELGAISEEDIREQYMRGLGLYRQMATWVKLKIEDSLGNMQDMTSYYDVDWVKKVEVSDGIDKKMAEMTATLKKNVGNLSLAYANKQSQLNRRPAAGSVVIDPFQSDYTDGSGNPESIANINRKVQAVVAMLPEGAKPEDNNYFQDFNDCNMIFEGYIDSVDWGGKDSVVIKCRDNGTKLRDAFVEDQIWVPFDSALNTGGCGTSAGPSETAMQNIITWAATDYLDLVGVTVTTPTSPSFCLLQSAYGEKNVFDMISVIAENIGWMVRYKWDHVTETFKLTYYSPDRSVSYAPTSIFPDMVISCNRVSLKLDEIRNVIRVKYKPTENTDYRTDSVATGVSEVTATNASSIVKYGRRFMEIAMADGGALITSPTEATTLAGNIALDLCEPKSTQTLSTRVLWYLEPNDFIKLKADGVRFDFDDDFAVATVKHVFQNRNSTSSIALRGKPSSGHGLHLSKNVAEAEKPNPLDLSSLATTLGANILDKLGNLINPVPTMVEPRINPQTLRDLENRITPPTLGGMNAYEMGNGNFQSNSAGISFATPDGWQFSNSGSALPRIAWGAGATTEIDVNSTMGPVQLTIDGSVTTDIDAACILKSPRVPIWKYNPFMISVLLSTTTANTDQYIRARFYQTTVVGVAKTETEVGQITKNIAATPAGNLEQIFRFTETAIAAACSTAPDFMRIEIDYNADGAVAPTDVMNVYNVQCWPLSPCGRIELAADLSLGSGGGKDTYVLGGMNKVFSYNDDLTTASGVTVWNCPRAGVYELKGTMKLEQTAGTDDKVWIGIGKYVGAGLFSSKSSWNILFYSSWIQLDYGSVDADFGLVVESGPLEVATGEIFAMLYFTVNNNGTAKAGQGTSLSWKYVKQKGLT